MSTSSPTAWLPDRPRQALNLALALAQPVVTILCFATGTSFFANTAAVLKHSGVIGPGASETAWSIALLVAAGAIGAWATLATGGNAPYALAIVWALGGIVVANTIERGENLPVAATACSMAALVAAALAWARITRRPADLARG